MFQFPSFASITYVFSDGYCGFAAVGFPIRKSSGQSLLGGSPRLIAACHVLHRLLKPGHPPCALIRLTTTQRMKEKNERIQNRFSKNCPNKPGLYDESCLTFYASQEPRRMVEVNGIEPMTSWLQTRRSPN